MHRAARGPRATTARARRLALGAARRATPIVRGSQAPHADLAYIAGQHLHAGRCAFTGCHQTERPRPASLQLTDGTSHAELVGVDAQSQIAVMNPHGNGDKWKRVVAGDLRGQLPARPHRPVDQPAEPRARPIRRVRGPIDPQDRRDAGQQRADLLASRSSAIQRWIMARPIRSTRSPTQWTLAVRLTRRPNPSIPTLTQPRGGGDLWTG